MDERGPLYCLDRVTDPTRRALYEKLETEGICQFCAGGVARGLVKAIAVFKHWYIVRCDPPYPGTTHHWMAISHKHAIDWRDSGAGDELLYIQKWFMQENKVRSVCMVQRKGDMKKTCSSIAHDHVHFTAASSGTVGDKTFQMDLGYWPK